MTQWPAAPRVSVVVASFNRPLGLERLLLQLASQTLAPEQFEVIVIDDGSEPPVSDSLEQSHVPHRRKLLRQANAGAAAARHRGVLESQGEILVITDDDMEVPPDFLASHLAQHPPGSRRVVIGRIRASPSVAEMPLFERFHARLFDRWESRRLRGNAVCTGNVSLRRSDYLAVGGFDLSFGRAEDMELGLRLEEAGVEVAFSEAAFTIHHSDHRDFSVWRKGAFTYGQYDVRIARKYPRLSYADPWRFFFGNAVSKRPFVMATLAFPGFGSWLTALVHRAALVADGMGLERAGLVGTSLLWDLEYFRGVRAEVGGFTRMLRSYAEFVGKVDAADERLPGLGRISAGMGRAVRTVLSRKEAR